MNFIKYFIAIWFLVAAASSCGQNQTVQLGEFAPYVQSFEDQASAHGQTVKVTNLIIQFGPMESSLERGLCEIDGNNTPTITIDQAAWETMDENQREPLIYHELGHCVLHRNHTAVQMAPGVPTSIMNPYTIPDYTYAAYRDHYLAELFTNENQF